VISGTASMGTFSTDQTPRRAITTTRKPTIAIYFIENEMILSNMVSRNNFLLNYLENILLSD
jgi:hypothetical protein